MSDELFRRVFAENLIYYMQKQNIKQIDIVNHLKLSKSTVSSWCSGSKIPRMDKIELLAGLLNINKSDLLEERGKINKLNSREELLLSTYRKLTTEGKEKVTDYVDMVYDSEQNKKQD